MARGGRREDRGRPEGVRSGQTIMAMTRRGPLNSRLSRRPQESGRRRRSTYRSAGPVPRRAHRGADECGRWHPARRSPPRESAARNAGPRNSSGSANTDLPVFAGRGVSNCAWPSLWRCAWRCRCSNPAKAAKLSKVNLASRAAAKIGAAFVMQKTVEESAPG